MQPNWYSTYTPKTIAGISSMYGGSDLENVVKFFRGTNYYTSAFDVDYTSGTT